MGGYNPLANLGLLSQLNPMGQALGSAAPIGALPGNPTMPAMAQPSGQAQAAMTPQPNPLSGINPMQQAMIAGAGTGPTLAPQAMGANPLSGVNPMQQALRGQQTNVQQPGFWSQFRNNLGQMGNAMGGAMPQGAAGTQTPQGTLGQVGNLLSGSALNTGGAMQKPQYPAAPQFSPIQMPTSTVVPGTGAAGGQGGMNAWQQLLANRNRNPFTGQ